MSIWVDTNGWPVPPYLLLGCLALEILYFRGWSMITSKVQAKKARATRFAVVGGSAPGHTQWDSWLWRALFFSCALFAFLITASAPIDSLSSHLFWVHMIQHLLLLGVVPLLLVASAPFLPLWLGLPRQARRLFKIVVRREVRLACYHIGRWLLQPAVSSLLLIVGIWLWHWPPLYDLALTNAAIHDWLEHSTFLGVSLLFWAQVIPSPPLRPRLSHLGRMGCVGIAIVQNIVLAAALGFAQHPLYAPYAHLVTGPGGFTALQDQSLGAGIMWTFGDLPFAIAFSVLLHQWLGLQADEDGTVQLENKQRA
ncbi:MAG TPA: cytochrome c oxidase assembly protein [Ktedonobacteraceae bacterium]